MSQRGVAFATASRRRHGRLHLETIRQIMTSPPPSGQPRLYRVTQLHTDGVHCRESAGIGPVNLKQGSSERMLPWQVTMDQLICASLSHTHYWYEVGMHIEVRLNKGSWLQSKQTEENETTFDCSGDLAAFIFFLKAKQNKTASLDAFNFFFKNKTKQSKLKYNAREMQYGIGEPPGGY